MRTNKRQQARLLPELDSEGHALRQIKDRRYAGKRRVDGCPIHLIGVELSRDASNVVGFAVE